MPADRYYLNGPLKKGETVILQETERHHLISVMRARLNDPIEIVNGKGEWAQAELAGWDKKAAYLKIQEVCIYPPPSFSVILCQALPRMNRLDTIVEKGTELGMTEIWLFPGDNSEREALSDSQQKRLESIAIAAMKQCGRFDLPKIVYMPPLTEWKKENVSTSLFFGDTALEAPWLAHQWQKEQRVSFFIGPESGFSDSEVTLLRQMGAKGVRIHTNILRTDTAALAALSLIDQLKNANNFYE